ncbi:hypothetical protein Tco_0394010 [Tanacetum coccineum]
MNNSQHLQIEDFLQTTSEDEPDIKDDTSPKEDVGNVYCCDDNGDDPLFFMHAKPDDILKMAEVAEQKIKSKIQRLYKHRETRLNKIAEEDKERKIIWHMNSSAHMKLAIERCVPKKRKYADVMRFPYIGLSTTLNVPSMEQLANQKNVLNPLMIKKCKSVKPYIEDLPRPFKRIDKFLLSHDLEEFLSRYVVDHCKFPWCNNISVDRSFWNGLCGLDDNRKGWLLDEWYLKRRECLEEKFHVVLKETSVFEKKIIDPAKYKISFRRADHVSKQVFFSNSTYGLAYGVPLAVDDPIQTALAYQEKKICFYFQHKMLCP